MTELQDILSSDFLQHPDFHTALRHRSAGKPSNERLEYIGDAVLGMIIAETLYRIYDEYTEAELTRMRSSLVCNETLAELAQTYQIPDLLQFGKGMTEPSVRVYGNALEAIIGALYLVEGLESVRRLIQHLYESKLKSITDIESLKDSKSRLQEYLQSLNYNLPQYQLIDDASLNNEWIFQIKCIVTEMNITTIGEGSTKSKAEQVAASKALAIIQDNDD